MDDDRILRVASDEEFKQIYAWMRMQFHLTEIKPLGMMRRLRKKGVYEVYGLWENDQLQAYALLGYSKNRRYCLLDYFAALPSNQGRGYGSALLQMLRGQLDSAVMLIEVENPEFARDAAERAKELRRIRFYQNNGCTHTSLRVKLFGHEYLILTLGLRETLDDGEVERAIDSVYTVIIPPAIKAVNAHYRREEIYQVVIREKE